MGIILVGVECMGDSRIQYHHHHIQTTVLHSDYHQTRSCTHPASILPTRPNSHNPSTTTISTAHHHPILSIIHHRSISQASPFSLTFHPSGKLLLPAIHPTSCRDHLLSNGVTPRCRLRTHRPLPVDHVWEEPTRMYRTRHLNHLGQIGGSSRDRGESTKTRFRYRTCYLLPLNRRASILPHQRELRMRSMVLPRPTKE